MAQGFHPYGHIKKYIAKKFIENIILFFPPSIEYICKVGLACFRNFSKVIEISMITEI